MSRRLRSGRNYDAVKVPVAPKRQTRKRKASTETKPEEPKQSKKKSGEQAKASIKGQLIFGTTSGVASDHGKGIVIVGTGRRRGIALNGDGRVKFSPAVYMALTNRAPPIRRVLSWPLLTIDPHAIADAPIKREVTSHWSVKADKCAPGVQATTPGRAKGSPAAPSAPSTPATTRVHKSSSDNDVYVTARTSRVPDDSIALDGQGQPLLAQYVVNGSSNESPTSNGEHQKRHCCKSKAKDPAESPSNVSKSSANHEGLTWDEEVRRVTRSENPYWDTYSDLPDGKEWVNPDWSRSDYLCTPATTSNECSTETGHESVQVNALIYKVNENYMFNDDKYTEVLRSLRERDKSESGHSQTRGAGPSHAHQTHRVTIEEVEDKSSSTATSRAKSYAEKGKGKKKSKPKKKSKKRKRPSLGMALDDPEGPHERTTRARDATDTSVNYRGGSYLENLIGTTPARVDRGRETSRAKETRSVSGSSVGNRLDDRRTHQHDPTMSRGVPAMPIRQQTPPGPSDSLGINNSDSESTHTSSSDGSSDSFESSDSDERQSFETRTNGLIQSHNRRANWQLAKTIKKLKKQNRRLEKKIVTQAQSGYKAQSPKAYKGNADIDKYNMFIFNYNLFVSNTRLSNNKAMLTMSRFLEDQAATWYMLNVAPNPDVHTIETIYIRLYEYCFPPDFKDKMHCKYNHKRQGESSVQDYFAELTRLGRRLCKIDDQQHVLRVWDGAAQYIKIDWALKGIQAETSDIVSLREIALDIECAHKIKRSIEKSGNEKSNPRRDWSRSSTRKRERSSNYRSKGNNPNGNFRGDNRNQPAGNGNGNRANKRQNNFKWNERNGGRDGTNYECRKLTNEKKAELRAANKCFECENMGHLSKDCPKFHKARPSHICANAMRVSPKDKVRVSSVMLKELDKLTRLKDKIEVNAVFVNLKGKGPGVKHIERNAVKVKDNTRKVPNTLVVEARIEGESVCILLDSGCQTDLISTTLVDQLKLPKEALTKPPQVQLAMAGYAEPYTVVYALE